VSLAARSYFLSPGRLFSVRGHMGWRDDPLWVCQTNRPCSVCAPEIHECPPRGRCKKCMGNRGRRRNCQTCHGCGFPMTDALLGLWRNRAAFLVCGGPSLAELPLERLRERGVSSLAINNAGAYAPVKAHTFGDPESKFHSAMMADANVLSFVPFGKLHYPIQIKHEGEFYPTRVKVCDCPAVFGISRTSTYSRETFLSSNSAHWGSKLQPLETQDGKYSKLCTMLLGMRLLHYLGCRRIYMLGVDFWVQPRDQGPGYAWGDAASCSNKIWDSKIGPMMIELKPIFEAADIDIFNCNRYSRCRAFDHVPFDQAMDDCKGPVEDEPLDLHDWYNKSLAKEHHARHPEPLSEQQISDLRTLERQQKAGAT